MTKNVGGIDRIVRILLGLALVALGLSAQDWWGAVGLVPLVTGLVGWCPLYVPLRLSTGASA
jgi:type IV secretory pathway TrbD component